MSVKYFNCLWQHRGENHTCIHVHVTALHVFFCFLLLSFFVFFFTISYFIFQFDTGFFSGMPAWHTFYLKDIWGWARILFCVYYLILVHSQNFDWFISVLFFSLSRVDNHLCFINVRMCLFLSSPHIELGH